MRRSPSIVATGLFTLAMAALVGLWKLVAWWF